jgi:phenylacetic acid degradation operon negative regulatory protein
LNDLAAGVMRDPGLRIWSLLVTILGDAISPRGGVVRLGALQTILDRIGVEPGALRTAASRLVRDGWLARDRRGRAAFYRLAPGQQAALDRATRRIYAAGPRDWDGVWLIALAPEERAAARDARAAALAAQGFGRLAPGAYLHPHALAAEGFTDMTLLRAPHDGVRFAPGALAAAWPEAATAAAHYRDLLARFAPIDAARAAPRPLDALAARALLIHLWRRAVLRDPGLPAEIAPADWPGEAARALAARLHWRLAGPSEAWLDACDGGPDGPLPPPGPDFATRFGGRR